MVTKYYILACSNDTKLKGFKKPRQLTEINKESLIGRTIRLLKENGIEDIIIIAKDKKFDKYGKRYEPLNNSYDYNTDKGYWLDAFPFEIMNEPLCFIWGDVYFSDEAIKTIVNTDTNREMFFCSYNNKSEDYIKHHDEPFAYKIVNTELFKDNIRRCKKMYDEGKTCRNPIVWEVYRSINGIYINEHKMKDHYVAINDITCDIDNLDDVKRLEEIIKKKVKSEKL